MKYLQVQNLHYRGTRSKLYTSEIRPFFFTKLRKQGCIGLFLYC